MKEFKEWHNFNRFKRRMAWIKTPEGKYQTYLFPEGQIDSVRYKCFTILDELEQAIAKCKAAGWVVTNPQKLVGRLNRRTKKRP